MSESILERIALWHTAALAEITVANGYHQTLSVTRPEELGLDAKHIEDLTTICCLGECVEDQVRTNTRYFWSQIFEAFVHVIADGGPSIAVDTRITRIIGDIHKRIGVELAAAATNHGRYCGGLAYRMELLPWSIGVSDREKCNIVSAPIAIAFETLADDPYQQ